MPNDYPIIRLMPKADARAIRHGQPWVYANDIVTDRRSKNLPAGAIAMLQDASREDLAIVTVNPGSKIFARVLDLDLNAQINRDWIAARLNAALAHRRRLFDQPFYRLIHAEGDGLPGVIIDRFGEYAVVQPNAAWAEHFIKDIAELLTELSGIKHVLKNASGRSRQLEGLDRDNSLLIGNMPDEPIAVPMNGASYMADLADGQKTGLFYDQRPNHAFAARLAQDARVLDVFSHVGGFSLAALAGGASSALAIDGSASALSLANSGAEVMGVSNKFSTRQCDAFDGLNELLTENQRFDVVICDPPAFAPAKSALESGLRAYERVAKLSAPLVEPGGYLALCSCSHAATLEKFRNSCLRGIGRAGRKAQLIHTGFAGPDHPIHPNLANSGYLKALFFRILS